jgi:hypothetical protein
MGNSDSSTEANVLYSIPLNPEINIAQWDVYQFRHLIRPEPLFVWNLWHGTSFRLLVLDFGFWLRQALDRHLPASSAVCQTIPNLASPCLAIPHLPR